MRAMGAPRSMFASTNPRRCRAYTSETCVDVTFRIQTFRACPGAMTPHVSCQTSLPLQLPWA